MYVRMHGCMYVCMYSSTASEGFQFMRSILHCIAWPAAEYDEGDVMAEPQEEGRGE